MTDNEIMNLFNTISNRMTEMNKRIDDVFVNMHNQSTQKIDEITPYTATQTAYYGESVKNFYDVPEGNVTVFWDNYNGDYSVQRFDGGVNVSFETLTVAEATISIMVQ